MTEVARKLSLLVGVLGLCSTSGVASASQGCEFVTVLDFFESVVLPGAHCAYSVDRDVYECSDGSSDYDLSVEVVADGDGRGHAVRSDGFKLVFTCSCSRICEYEDSDS